MRSRPQWRTRTAAPATSRLAVAGEVVAIPARVDDVEVLVGWRLADGRPAWTTPMPGFLTLSALSRVMIAGGAEQLILAQDGQVAAVAAGDGARRWSARVPAEEPFESYTIGPDPILDDARAYLLSRRSRLVAIDRATGALAWRTDDDDDALTLAVGAGVVVTRSAERADVRAFDAATGAPRWQRPLLASPRSVLGETSTVAARESLRHGRFVTVDGDRTVVALDAATGAIRWEEPIVAPATLAWAGELLIVADAASVRAIDRGAKVTWRHPTGGHALVAPLDDRGALLALATAICTVDAATGEIVEQARRRLDDRDVLLDAGPGAVALTTSGVARCYRRAGAGLAETTLGAGVLQAVIAGGRVVTFDKRRVISCFG